MLQNKLLLKFFNEYYLLNFMERNKMMKKQEFILLSQEKLKQICF